MNEEKKLTDEELKKAFFILRHGSDEGLSEYVKAVLAIENEYNRQKAEIERLNGCILTYAETLGNEQRKSAELQKQVDELKEENTELYKEHTTLIVGSILQKQDIVKDTAEEILTEIDDLTLFIINGSNEVEKGYFQAIADMKTAIKDLLKEKYGVEVE